MVRYVGVTKRIKHDETQQRAERRNEITKAGLNASPEAAPKTPHNYASDSASDNEYVGRRVKGRNIPLRIDERQVGRPQELAQVEPDRPRRHEHTIKRP